MTEEEDREEMAKLRQLASELRAIQDRTVESARRVLKTLSSPPPPVGDPSPARR
jgi:hypothetical protein